MGLGRGYKAHRFASCLYGLKPVPFNERRRYLSPHFCWASTARLKSCPDTKRQNCDYQKTRRRHTYCHPPPGLSPKGKLLTFPLSGSLYSILLSVGVIKSYCLDFSSVSAPRRSACLLLGGAGAGC